MSRGDGPSGTIPARYAGNEPQRGISFAPVRDMIWVDYAIIAILVVSAGISVLRGFLREALSLAGWVLAFWLALTFADDVSGLFSRYVSQPSMRHGLAFFTIVVGTLVITAIVMYLVRLIIDKTEITGTDRALGIVFGIARGIVIVAILVLLAGLTALPKDPWWRESIFLPHFQVLAVEIQSLLPPEVAILFQY
jgi:membrane protein required for colicin V production